MADGMQRSDSMESSEAHSSDGASAAVEQIALCDGLTVLVGWLDDTVTPVQANAGGS